MKTNKNTEQEWKQIIQKCQKRSGTIPEWCENNEINIHTYKYWVSRLNKKENVILSSAPTFVPLPLLNQMKTQPHIHPESSELRLRYKEFELVVPKDVNSELLLQVLTCLQTSC